MSFSNGPSEYQVTQIDQAKMDKIVKGLMSKNDWVKSKRIEEVMSMASSEVRAYINHIRQQGIPVVSGAKGYKYTTDPAEIEQCLAHLYSRARAIRDAATGLQTAYKIITGISKPNEVSLFDFIEDNA